jgi:hypothetical protein
MFSNLTRRHFLGSSLKAGALVGLADLGFLRNLRPVSADEARPAHDKVRFGQEIEPLVRLLEDTPREKLFPAVADQMRRGVGYQQLLTALFLAGVRGIQPRPVGHKFHAVLVVNSAHLASLAMPDQERWLPLFWALDNFKNSQERNLREGGWFMTAAAEGQLPPSTQARKRFIEAMDNWDEEGAERAIVSLVRHAGMGEIIELFWIYGARDFRDIGHKAIYAANSWRTLQAIGLGHAEPIMRSLAYAMLEHEGSNPAHRDAEVDRPWRENLERARRLRPDWQEGKAASETTTDLLKGMRQASAAEACDQIVHLGNRGMSPQPLWDALFLRAGELLMQQPGIIGIHCVTSINALHYAYQASAIDHTRRMLLLQAAAFLALFHKRMAGEGLNEELQVDSLGKYDTAAKGADAVAELLHDISQDRLTAARKTIGLLDHGAIDPQAFMTAARRLVFSKGNDSHDYKFSSAALEDFYSASPPWRSRYLATSMFNLRGSGDRDNELIQRARAALATV